MRWAEFELNFYYNEAQIKRLLIPCIKYGFSIAILKLLALKKQSVRGEIK